MSIIIEEIERKGYSLVGESMFLEKTILKLVYDYWHTIRPENEPQNFYAILNIPEKKYKEKSDQFLKDIFEPFVNSILSGYRILFASFVIKLPGKDSFLPLHQDWSYIEGEKNSSVVVWIPISEMVENSGLIFSLPGTHKLFTYIRGSNFQSFSPVSKFGNKLKSYWKTINIQKKQALVFSSAMAHGSYSNLSGTPRIAVAICCIPLNTKPIHFRFIDNEFLKYSVKDTFFTSYTIGDEWPNDQIIKEEKIKFEPPNLSLQEIKHFLENN
jgi:Phytanoyl-CoA dioxygenase (PhyH)